MKKEYIKPEAILIKVETETLMGPAFSQEGNGGVGITPGGDVLGDGDADAKENDDDIKNDIWGDDW